jgi:uncharacterized protein (DUF2267 family)
MDTSYEDFTGEVQHRIEAGTQAEAVRTVRSVLETLGERVEAGGATDVASPLPMEIDRYLLQVEHGHTYDYETFIDRVQARLNYDDLGQGASYGPPAPVDRGDTVYRTKATVALLSETVPGEGLAHVEDQLPSEFAELFEFVDAETAPWESAAE